MSLSVEDLVSSLSSSHIGQEAMDLAALQVQLAQTLFCQSMSSSSMAAQDRKDDYNQPCNTPTNRTPSASFSWGQMIDSARHSDSTSRRNSEDHEMEDERMVEDLLIPTSPMSANPSTASAHFSIPQSSTGRTQNSPPKYPSYEPTPSLFTTTDPFYIEQLQAAQNYSAAPPSMFSQAAFPSQQSPFIHSSNFQRHNAPANSHALFAAATSSPFDR
ncbi:hypothetical protein C8J57DRAFT_1120892 [Mycena rebaudengoi]|nr:hypothetical protein C8J57DRAFT_1120892 [Mycena rebaudengoi]